MKLCDVDVILARQIKFVFVTVLQETFYSTKRGGPVITGAIYGIPNQVYRVKIEVLKIDLDHGHEYVSSITLNGKNFGTCTGMGTNDCGSFHDCSQNIDGYVTTRNSITSTNGRINIVLRYTPSVNCCQCTWKGIPNVQAVARITLNTIAGEIN